ncbi:MAG: hypothetical protein IJW47_04490 [Clostridia bacterium]|nr:hypothetical protein [Clostridia bacterium]
MSVFFDSSLSAFICFILSLAVLNYKDVSYPLHLAIALAIALAVFILLIFVLKQSSERKIKSREDKKLYESFCNELYCQTRSYIAQLLLKAVQKSGYTAEIKENIVFAGDNVCLFGICSFDKISPDKLVKCYKLTPENYTTAVVCTDLSPDAQNLANNLSARIKVIALSELFIFLKSNEMLPPITVKIGRSKKKFRDLLKESFCKKRSGHFFYVGSIMLVFSFFVFYPKYYLIMGTFFCALGLTCLLYGKKT